jgi:Tfp pilus assembly protein PilF
MGPANQPGTRRGMRQRAVLLAIALLAVAGFVVWKCRPHAAKLDADAPALVPAPEDPRLTYATPYRNVRPDVRYVGQQACAGCHPKQAASYRNHPMGRSLAPIASASQLDRYDAAAKNPFDAFGFRYEIERQGERVVHREIALDANGGRLFAVENDVSFAVGSGTRGRTYLVNHDGYLFQSPITWYPEKKAWDLSPGFDQIHHHFGRPVPADCLFCHSNRAYSVEDAENRYEGPVFEGHAIGCERCHGPGELHVGRQHAKESYEGMDDTIVNPGNLDPVLRNAVCEQCHLQGVVRILRRGRQPFEFRPGLPLHLFLSVYVKPPSAGEHKFVGQVEQMVASRCYQASDGRMACISCHDPHVFPGAEERVAYYRDRCLSCHGKKGCSLPLADRRAGSKDDNCMQCHMPAGESDIQHHSITDHRIPRRSTDAGQVAAQGDGLPIVHFHKRLLPADDPEAARDLGIALADRIERYPPRVRQELGESALARLKAALQRDPADVPALDAKAHALWAVGDRTGAAAAFTAALDLAPRREVTLQWAAALALEQKQPTAAVGLLERAIAVNPWRHEYHYLLAEALAQRKQWPGALKEAEAALNLNPANTRARQLLVECMLENGRTDEARAEMDRLLALKPPNAAALRSWFAQRVR